MTTTCSPCGDATGQGNALAAPRRNRYFYGKLLDVPHMQMEQDYGKLKRWLMNRLSVGTGILCGLGVTVKDGKVCVSGGVAIDSFGREIIVPATYCIDPWKLPDDCGNPVKELDRNLRHLIQLRVCYRECLTDNSPVQVSDCNSACACEAGTTIESFQFQIVQGAPDRPTSDVCDLMHLDDNELAEVQDIPAFIRQRLCEKLPHPCLGDKDCCVLLAVIELLPDGRIGVVQSCAVRTVLYSNEMLFEMILCLVGRVEQCCGGKPHPGPPPPEHKSHLQVRGMRILDRDSGELAAFANPGTVPSVPVNKQPFSIEATFTEPLDQPTVTTGDYTAAFDPKSFSFLVESDARRFTRPYVPGTIQFPVANVARFDLEPKNFDVPFLPQGTYTVTLFGDADPTPGIARPAISAQVDDARLDGEPRPSFPSGDGVEGGQFICKFVVK